MKRNTVIEIISFLFIFLFGYAAVIKLMDYEKFSVQVGQSPLLIAFGGWISWMIPTIELIIVGMLIFPRFRLIGMYASFTLMVMFTIYIVMILNFASHVPCSCGGILEKMGWTEHLIFNIGFVFLALIGVIMMTRQETRKHQTLAV